ncbi:type I inositol-1,4,5-trisphosphate 5-phosphatase [Musa troglodytarum]|uniref:Type I inositol-1,4,5-trisphosphate 5-phosphatase n=1 Tax=Musa troglodytarum TaxID=320322 RepID=A0A9E7HAR8_9LILI|nr:type I inositol-1,4,5-trisphosphate 5-phosphatase [Musa troglodytarum]
MDASNKVLNQSLQSEKKGIRDNSPEDRDRDKHRNREQCTGKNLMAELRVASTHHEITSHAAAVA